MGMVTSRIHRAVGRFNVENRAQRVLSKTKLEPAPRHPSTEKYFLDSPNDEEVKQGLSRKDPKLDDFLKSVYVTSHDPPSLAKAKLGKPSDRDRLPQYRGAVEETEFGFFDPEVVPEGKVSLRQVMTLLAECQADPVKNDAEAVMIKYKLQPNNTANILRYFGTFQVIINHPKDVIEPKKLPTPTVFEIEGVTKK